MLVKLYWSIWFAVVLIAVGLLLTGNFAKEAAVVFGFISFGLVFMGMIGVLPSTVAHGPARGKTSDEEVESFALARRVTNAELPVIDRERWQQRRPEALLPLLKN